MELNKFNFLHANTKYTVNTTSETWNLHVIDMILNFKCTDFLTLCQKERCVSLLNPLGHNMVYRRIMTAAFIWSLQNHGRMFFKFSWFYSP